MQLGKYKTYLAVIVIGIFLILAGSASHKADKPIQSLQRGPQIVDEIDLETGESYSIEINVPGYAVKPYIKYHTVPEHRDHPASYVIVVLDQNGRQVNIRELNGESSGTISLGKPGTYKFTVHNKGYKLSLFISVATYYYVTQSVKTTGQASTVAQILYYTGTAMAIAGLGLILKSRITS